MRVSEHDTDECAVSFVYDLLQCRAEFVSRVGSKVSESRSEAREFDSWQKPELKKAGRKRLKTARK